MTKTELDWRYMDHLVRPEDLTEIERQQIKAQQADYHRAWAHNYDMKPMSRAERLEWDGV